MVGVGVEVGMVPGAASTHFFCCIRLSLFGDVKGGIARGVGGRRSAVGARRVV